MKLLEFLQEDNGGFSASRLAFLLWICGALIAWLVTSITSYSLQEIPDSVVMIIGILMTGKVTQKFGEEPPKKNSEKPCNDA